MNRMIRAALGALTLTVILAGPAAAAKPIAETFEESGTFTIPCETVTLVEEYSQSVPRHDLGRWQWRRTRAHARVRFDGTHQPHRDRRSGCRMSGASPTSSTSGPMARPSAKSA